MARVSATEVREIIDLDSTIKDGQIGVFINGANITVTDVFSGNTQVSSGQLKEIERWFTAHMLCSLDPRAAKEQNEEVRVEYTGKYGKKLESSPYGQMVLTLDSTGLMAKLGNKKASIGVIEWSQ